MSFDSTLRTFQIPLLGGAILVASFFQARGIGQLVAGHLVPREPAALPASRSQPDTTRPKSGSEILARNPFDSVTGPLNKLPTAPKPDEETPKTVSANGDPYEDSPCSGVRASLITATDDPAWSFAALSSGDGEHMRRIGDKVGTQTVTHIGYYESPNLGSMPRVWLSEGGSRCIVAEGAPEPAAKPKPAADKPSSKSSKKAKLEAEVKSKITKIGENQFEVDKSGVEIIMQHYAKLAGSIRARGTKEGMRLSGIKPDSVLSEIGMQNGDLLSDINGFDMSDPEKAVDAYAKLRKAGKLDITMNRGGSPVTIKIQIK
jgi:general secretion pathway protein C